MRHLRELCTNSPTPLLDLPFGSVTVAPMAKSELKILCREAADKCWSEMSKESLEYVYRELASNTERENCVEELMMN